MTWPSAKIISPKKYIFILFKFLQNYFLIAIKKYSEEELISSLQMKDEHAFSYLYDNYSAALFGLIFKMVNDKELAQDILQEAFVKIWNNFSSYDNTKGRLFTWMLNLTRNLTIDTLRSKGYKKQSKIYSNENSVNNYSDKSITVEKYDAMGIRKQLTNLKNDQKQIIDLSYFGGFTQEEISKQLSIPLGTVKTRMRAAILELRRLLNNL
jgi:RNA polymerase sigma-70 factor (ECF subfamily)